MYLSLVYRTNRSISSYSYLVQSRSAERRVMCIRYHGAIGDQTDKCMRRKQTQADHQRILQSLEIILVHASVHDIQEDGRDLSTSCECIFNGRVLSQQLGWKVGVGNVAIVRRELVAVQTERADPELPARIDLAVVCNRASFKSRISFSPNERIICWVARLALTSKGSV